ncbi:MAG: DUF5320 domain-containing protein, partial [Thermodesulfobacteriota bacterium]
GRGFGRWPGWWAPPGWDYGPRPGWFASPEEEKAWLDQRAAILKGELEAVERRMRELAPEGES